MKCSIKKAENDAEVEYKEGKIEEELKDFVFKAHQGFAKNITKVMYGRRVSKDIIREYDINNLILKSCEEAAIRYYDDSIGR